MQPADYAIFVNGSYGVGKSSALDHIGDALAARNEPFSLMDVDWFHRSWPPAQDDPENVLTEAENMAAVWANYSKTGPRQLVASGVISSAAGRKRYQTAFGIPVRSVRLEASPEVTENRLRRRYTQDQEASLQWHLQRHETLTRNLITANLDELSIQTDDKTPAQIAYQILEHFRLCLSAQEETP
ncbi:hypothetical protein [Arthrobacter pigmenti]